MKKQIEDKIKKHTDIIQDLADISAFMKAVIHIGTRVGHPFYIWFERQNEILSKSNQISQNDWAEILGDNILSKLPAVEIYYKEIGDELVSWLNSLTGLIPKVRPDLQNRVSGLQLTDLDAQRLTGILRADAVACFAAAQLVSQHQRMAFAAYSQLQNASASSSESVLRGAVMGFTMGLPGFLLGALSESAQNRAIKGIEDQMTLEIGHMDSAAKALSETTDAHLNFVAKKCSGALETAIGSSQKFFEELKNAGVDLTPFQIELRRTAAGIFLPDVDSRWSVLESVTKNSDVPEDVLRNIGQLFKEAA